MNARYFKNTITGQIGFQTYIFQNYTIYDLKGEPVDQTQPGWVDSSVMASDVPQTFRNKVRALLDAAE